MGLSVNFVRELRLILPSLPTLTHLSLPTNALTDSSIPYLLPFLTYTLSLVHFDISGNELTNNGMRKVWKSLRKNQSVVSVGVGVGRNRIGETGL